MTTSFLTTPPLTATHHVPNWPLVLGAEGDDKAEQAVEGAVNLATFLVSAAGGVIVGMAVAIIVVVLLRITLRRTAPGRKLALRLRLPLIITLGLLGAAAGLNIGRAGVTDGVVVSWFGPVEHALWIAVIGGITWVLTSSVHVIEDITDYRYGDSEAGRARRVTTQTQVLRRVIQAVIVIIGIVVALLTFPSMRTAMTALLSSAGIVSLVAGIAAQNVLGNMFAGLQIAFTDSVRVGDILYYEDQYGTVEEITLTYMVLRLWDEKRLIVPSKKLTEDSIQNWTRRHTQVLGTVELPMDWSAPVPALRKEMQRLLKLTDLWDGETASIQITESSATNMVVRVCVSADNPNNLWDLRCYLREHMVAWAVKNAPYAMARYRLQQPDVAIPDTEDVTTGTQEAVTVPDYHVYPAGTASAEVAPVIPDSAENSEPDESDAESAASRWSLLRRIWPGSTDEDHAGDGRTVSAPASEDQTRVLSAEDIRALGIKLTDTNTPVVAVEETPDPLEDTASQRLYSGSPQAEQRARAFQGPGQKALEEREREIARQQGEDLPATTDSKESAAEDDTADAAATTDVNDTDNVQDTGRDADETAPQDSGDRPHSVRITLNPDDTRSRGE